MYYSQEVSLPVGFELIAKTEIYVDSKTGKQKRRSPITKNEYCKELIGQAIHNQLPFRFVLFDVWFSSSDNMKFIKQQQKRDFVCPLKTNRKVALSRQDKGQGRYQRLDTLELETNVVREIYLEGVEFPLLLAPEIFTNEDGSTGIIYLVCSDTSISFDEITTNYRKRWQVECYHKSLKQNASLAKSPTQTVTTQTNHFFAALCGYIKLEQLKIKTKANHFALKSKLYIGALQAAFKVLRKLNTDQAAA